LTIICAAYGYSLEKQALKYKEKMATIYTKMHKNPLPKQALKYKPIFATTCTEIGHKPNKETSTKI